MRGVMRCVTVSGAKGVDPAYVKVLLTLWPLLLAVLVFVELSAYCASRKSFRLQFSVGAVAFVLFVILQYAIQGTSYAMQTRPFAYFLVVAWVTATPLVALSLGAALLVKLRAPVWRQLGLAVLSLGVTAAYPIFALWSICTSGVDCV
jgi:hypothetical protein